MRGPSIGQVSVVARGRLGGRWRRHAISVYGSYVPVQVELEAGAVRAVWTLKVPLTSMGQHVVR